MMNYSVNFYILPRTCFQWIHPNNRTRSSKNLYLPYNFHHSNMALLHMKDVHLFRSHSFFLWSLIDSCKCSRHENPQHIALNYGMDWTDKVTRCQFHSFYRYIGQCNDTVNVFYVIYRDCVTIKINFLLYHISFCLRNTFSFLHTRFMYTIVDRDSNKDIVLCTWTMHQWTWAQLNGMILNTWTKIQSRSRKHASWICCC